MTLHVRAMAVWAPRFASLEAWRTRTASEPSTPAASILGARARGRASMLTRMISEVASAATQAAGVALARVPVLIGSAYGEMETTAQLLAMMHEGDGALSPARFQSSVHNAAAGLLSITTGNQGFSICLAAGDATTAALLFEAEAWLAEHGGDALVIMADERLPAFFSLNEAFEPAAAALVLSSSASGGYATLASSTRSDSSVQARCAELGCTPVAPMLAIIDAIASRRRDVLIPAYGSALSLALRYEAP
jgi:hypothetical protein